MKKILSVILIAVLLFGCAFSVQGTATPQARYAASDNASETGADECTCVCHLFYSVRDDLLQRILDKTIDCKTLFRVLSYYIRLFTWRVLGIRQYCPCGSRHY